MLSLWKFFKLHLSHNNNVSKEDVSYGSDGTAECPLIASLVFQAPAPSADIICPEPEALKLLGPLHGQPSIRHSACNTGVCLEQEAKITNTL